MFSDSFFGEKLKKEKSSEREGELGVLISGIYDILEILNNLPEEYRNNQSLVVAGMKLGEAKVLIERFLGEKEV